MRSFSQRVVILDPWGEVNRRYAAGQPVEAVTRFNPLSALDPASRDFADEVAALADALIIPDRSGQPHWTESAREMVKGLIAGVVERSPGAASLREVRELVTSDDDELVKAINFLRDRNPQSLAARLLRRFTKSTNEVSGIRSVAETQTAFLDSETLLAAMETGAPPFDLDELATGRVTIFAVLPLDRLETHGRWLRLLLTLTVRTIARQAKPPPVPVMFLLDEFGTVGKLQVIEQAFGLMAGIGVRVWAFLQDLNQLKRDYPESWETFISNASAIQVLTARDITTSSYISDYLGTTTTERISQSTKDKREGGLLGIGAEPGYMKMTDQVNQQKVLLPDDVRRIPPNLCLTIFPGGGAYMLHRVIYHADPRFAGRFRPQPGHAPAPAPAQTPPGPKLKGALGKLLGG